ncbi:hypothetical protein [Dyadobacter chenhuakuii]|uniref:HEPN domain-containing protein n=1 Tax=Dyadobacter chenhuakuii TaxID=2909339 RepID=A0A9X1TRV2_9BACT|nr:hypothetical protein [Dyadobacter chenhuakuii]MCF2498354.1 hypothetical protein [Dyadobacter chenhuakuii]
MSKREKKYLELELRDYPAVLSQASSFYDVGYKIVFRYLRLKEAGKWQSTDNSLLAVAAANMMVAFELYFKSLILLTKGEYETGHQLKTLFQELPDEIKVTLDKKFEILKATAKGNFPIIKRNAPVYIESYNPWTQNISLSEFLDIHSDGFIEWRYQFQTRFTKTIYADFSLMHVLYLCIVDVLKNLPVIREDEVIFEPNIKNHQ